MTISATFTQEELRLIHRALTFGIIHTDEERESQQMKGLDQKINILEETQQGMGNNSIMADGGIVIVVDLSNYETSYAESTPFRAQVKSNLDDMVYVESLATGKKYEIYSHQILESLDIEEIIRMIDISKYGR